MIIAISNEFIRMASGRNFFPQVLLQFPGIFGHSCVLSKPLGHTIQPVTTRRILVQCCKNVKDPDLHSYRFRGSFFASCQSKILFGPETAVKSFVCCADEKAVPRQISLKSRGKMETEIRQQQICSLTLNLKVSSLLLRRLPVLACRSENRHHRTSLGLGKIGR